ncbi:UNVERIFIED_CONTAM: hypothetical protein RMT77_000479 [Armadillidium vulgare]
MKIQLWSENFMTKFNYLALFSTSVFVNKYVLSVLNFLYPTVFQGWQTLIGAILLKILLSFKILQVSSTSLDMPGFISLLPTFLFFSAGIVASSKALAGLSVPIFLCLQNTVNALLCIIQMASGFREYARYFISLCCVLNLVSATAVIFYGVEESFSDSPYMWMLVYVACLSVQTIHSSFSDDRYNEIDRLYYCYVFSVIVLAPASLYLEEAFEVLKFPHVARIDFYGGCLLSGIVGVMLNLVLFKVRVQPYYGLVDTLSRFVMSFSSLLIFTEKSSLFVSFFICTNFISSIFIPIYKTNNLEELSETETFQPLISEEL